LKPEQLWKSTPYLWDKIKPLARQKRQEPTLAEDQLWNHLRKRQRLGFKFRRQHTIERFIVDFYCAEAWLVIEVDGSVHDYTVDEDAIRQEFLESTGLRVIRFTNDDVLNCIETTLERLDAVLREIK
jgi:very-short-patch-repair endonuclease